MKKNDIIELQIEDMTNEGLGISKLNGQVFFVKDALLGDKVNAVVTKVGSNIAYAKVISIVEESPYRIDARCKVSNACGGCQLLCLDYKKQLELKKKYVINCLKKIGKFNIDASPYEGILGSDNPYNFRNKMQVPYALKDGEVIYGFYAGRTHHIVTFDNCIISFEGTKIILDAVKEALVKFNISIYDEKTSEGTFREVMLRKGNATGEISITYILNDEDYKKKLELYKRFDEYVVLHCRGEHCEPAYKIITSTININTKNTNAIFGNKNVVIRGNGFIEDRIGDIKYRISPESFYQVNSEMTKVLYDKIIEYGDFKPSENVLDLYCGIGTISLYIARKIGKILGLEIVKKAVENAKENAIINDIKNAEFATIDLGNDKEALDDVIGTRLKSGVDTVIVDPPRKGLDSLTIDYLKKIKAKKIIYVSCNPTTLARDLDILCHGESESRRGEQCEPKYRLDKIVNVDMFPHTMHVETICVLNIND